MCSNPWPGVTILLGVQSGKSKLWLQQQAEADVRALGTATSALQPLFLEIAALDWRGPTADAASALLLAGLVQTQMSVLVLLALTKTLVAALV